MDRQDEVEGGASESSWILGRQPACFASPLKLSKALSIPSTQMYNKRSCMAILGA